VSRRSLEHWTLLALIPLGFAAVVVLGVLVEPDPRGFGTHEKLGFAPCRFLALTGLPCPGCGVTTSIAHAARLDVAGALAAQPFGLVVVVLLPVVAVVAVVLHVRGRDLGQVVRTARLGWWIAGVGVLALGGWIWKALAMRPGG
jgi:hypothetical protein